MTDINDDPFEPGFEEGVDARCSGGEADAQAVRDRVAELAAMEPLDYEMRRESEAKALGLRVSVLDGLVRRERPAASPKGGAADAAGLEVIEPWPDAVDGAELAELVRGRLRAHVAFGVEADADTATLWVMGSYLMDTWRLWPRLLITSPTKQCGKSTLLEVIEALAHRALLLSNASPAAVFRSIEAWQPTLLLDEADTWVRQNEELSGILNSGHTRRTARVVRVQEVDGQHVPTVFSTWCPMVIAGIGGQRDTLMSRSIILDLRRRLPDETVERMPFDLFEQLHPLRRKLARWAADHAQEIGALKDEPPACGDDRRRDNFTPLWRIARVLGGPWPDRILAGYAAQAQNADEDGEGAAVMLLRDVAAAFEARPGEKAIPSGELVERLVSMEGRPWAEWRRGWPIMTSGVARLLKPFGIRPKNIRRASDVVKGYDRAEVEAAFARYAQTPSIEPLQSYATENKQKNSASSRYTGAPCSGSEGEKNALNQACSSVAAQEGGIEAEGAAEAGRVSPGGRAVNRYAGIVPDFGPDDPDAWA